MIAEPLRFEDDRLLKGAGRYVSDRAAPQALWAAFVRADRAHARITRLDTAAARAMPGVLAVLTAEDVAAAGFGSLPTLMPVKGAGGMALAAAHRPVLARGLARYVGEPVAMVVAGSRLAAEDAAGLVEIDWQELPAVLDAQAALAPGAPRLHEEAPGNLAFEFEAGDAAAVETAFAGAAYRVRLDMDITRVVGNPMEPRGCIGEYDAARDEWTLAACIQGPYHIRQQLSQVLGAPIERIRVLADDVGGSFGVHSNVYPEDCAVLLAAKRLGRPVRWTASRSELFLSDEQGRDVRAECELALDTELRMLAMRFAWTSNLGAYPTLIGPVANTLGASVCLTGVYAVPAACVRVRLAYTNTVPTASYRGAGRPLMSTMVERLVDEAAARLDVDPAALRRRNLVPATAFPYRLPNGAVIDCGDFGGLLERALAAADWAGYAARHAASRARGQLRGRGLACYIESTGSGFVPVDQVRFRAADGLLFLHTATHSHGQGHETSFAQIVAGELGIAPQRVRLRTADASGPLLVGNLTSGSRSLAAVGSVVLMAARALKEKVAALGGDLERLLAEPRTGDAHPLDFDFEGKYGATFPNGCHVAEVEIDPETGVLAVERYLACDDVGRVVNRAIVAGQMHGGIAQGAGQILGEQARYDTESGQLLTGSFMDYPMPRADTLPAPALIEHPVPTAVNPLGAKGAGEGGTTGAMPALMNAVADALRGAGLNAFDMPATPARLWAALRDRRG